MLQMLLPAAASLNGGGGTEAAAGAGEAHLREDGLPSDEHFAALAAEPARVQRATRRAALLLALQHAGSEDLQRHAGGAEAAFSAVAALQPAAAFAPHLRAIVDADTRQTPPLAFLAGLFGPHASGADAAVQVLPSHDPSTPPLSPRQTVVISLGGHHCPPRVAHADCWALQQVRALDLLRLHYAVPRPAHAAADASAAFHVALPRLLAAAAAPERVVRAAALAALPVLAASLAAAGNGGSHHAAVAPAHIAALAAGVTRQRADLKADAAALPAALRHSLQPALHSGRAGSAAADNRCAPPLSSPVLLASCV